MIYKKKIFLLFFFFALFTIVFCGCENDPIFPTYQGMTITELTTESTTVDETNINDGYSDGLSSTINDIDQEDPFKRFDGKKIEDIIEDKENLKEEPYCDYYFKENIKLLMTVKLYNPNSFDILSITINQIKYQSFQFYKDSDSENIMLEFETKDPGKYEFLVSDITFSNGKEISSVELTDNTSISLGIQYGEFPCAEIESFDINVTSASFNIEITDEYGLIQKSGNTLRAVIYDGEEITSFNVNVGKNTVQFTDLMAESLYQFAVYAVFDTYQGEGKQVQILTKKAFYTDDILKIQKTLVTSNSILFQIIENDSDQGLINSISLYKDDSLVTSLTDIKVRLFETLEPDTDYVIKTKYCYGSSFIVTDEMSVRTAKLIPNISLNNLKESKESIEFSLSISDEFNILNYEKVDLFKDDTLISSSTPKDIYTFDNLLSNSIYIIRVPYSYDANDGAGIINRIAEFNISTLPKDLPTCNIIIDYIYDTSVEFTLEEEDIDQTYISKLIEIYNSSIRVNSLDEGEENEFPNLLTNNLYTIKVKYIYNLNDGSENKTLITSKSFTTKANEKPTVDLVIDNITQSVINYDITLTDNSDVVTSKKTSLLLNGKTIKSLNTLTTGKFEGLLSNNDYQLVLELSYDLKDGNGNQVIKIIEPIRTLKNSIPELMFSVDNVTHNSIGYSFQFKNPNSVKVIQNVKLVLHDELKVEVDNFSSNTFDNLLSDNEYTIIVQLLYDLNDGKGLQEILIEKNVRTIAKATPQIDVNITEITQESITFETSTTDIDSVGYLKPLELIYNNNIITSTNNLSIDQLLSGKNYILRATYAFNLDDGRGLRKITKDVSFKTIEKATPTLTIDTVDSTSSSINFAMSEKDIDNIGNVHSIVLLKDGVTINQQVNVFSGSFTDLEPLTQYVLKVTYTYDLNDGNGINSNVFEVMKETYANDITITQIALMNNVTPKVGDMVHLRILIDNPSMIAINSFIVNNHEINAIEGENINSAIIRFIPDTNGGEFSANVSRIKYSSFGKTFELVLANPFEFKFNILGNLDVIDLYNIDNRIGLDLGTDIIVSLDNPTSYEVNQIVINFNNTLLTYNKEEIVEINPNEIKVPFKGVVDNYIQVLYDISVESITYGIKDSNESTIKNITDVSTQFAILKSLIIRDITNVAELRNMEDGYIYQLIEDIDLLNNPWVPYDFIGIFDGNGKTIENISIVIDNYTDQTLYIGLFSRFVGIFSGLTLNNIYYSINSESALYIGGLAGYAQSSIISNNSIIGNISTSNQMAIVNAIVGDSISSFIDNNTVNVLIN